MTGDEPGGTEQTDADPDLLPAQERRPPRTVPAGAFVIAVMLAMALGVLAIVALTGGVGNGDDASGDERELRLAAGRFAERFLTFEHDALDDWKDDVLDLSTGGFAEEVADVESGLRALIAENELDAVTQVTDIFVGEPERGTVDVVIIYDRDIQGDGVDRTETDRYLQLSMIRVEGQWLVDNVLDVATAGDAGAPLGPDTGGEAPAAPSSTTAPAPAGDG